MPFFSSLFIEKKGYIYNKNGPKAIGFFIIMVQNYIKDIIINSFGYLNVPVKIINNLVFIKSIVIKKSGYRKNNVRFKTR